MGLLSGAGDVSVIEGTHIDMQRGEVLRKLARVQRALRVSLRLLDSVAYVATEGDTEGPLSMLERAQVDCSELRGAI